MNGNKRSNTTRKCKWWLLEVHGVLGINSRNSAMSKASELLESKWESLDDLCEQGTLDEITSIIEFYGV
jgi:hypothetical protein